MDKNNFSEPVVDPVGLDALGSTEICFSVPESYNASAVLFDNLSAGRGTNIALHSGDLRLSYAALCALSCQAGNALVRTGLARSDRVVMLLDDTPVYPAAFFGAVRAGFVPVLVNTLSPAELVQYYIEDSSAEIVIAESNLLPVLSEALENGADIRLVVVANGEQPEAFPVATVSWDDFVSQELPELAAADTHRDDMAFWMYSSGSTGRPKGIVHLQHDMPYTHLSYAEHVLKLTENDIVYSVPKIFFAYGFGNAVTFPFSVGAAVVLASGRPEPGPIYDVIEEHKPTVFFGLPTLYNALVAHEGSADRDLSSVRLCISAAEPLPGETFDIWSSRYGLEILEGLGSTEVLHIYVSNYVDDLCKGASGKRVPGYEVELRDMDGKIVPPGEAGTMWVRGDSQAPFYWNQPDKTAETMREDWIYTGDRFTQDEGGFYHFAGRADDLIKVSGQWIHPLEIERCLNDHPDVQESCVLGVQQADGLMTTKAWIVLKSVDDATDEKTQALKDYVKSKLLPYKYPRVVEYHDDLPKTGTGKIDRQKLRSDG